MKPGSSKSSSQEERPQREEAGGRDRVPTGQVGLTRPIGVTGLITVRMARLA